MMKTIIEIKKLKSGYKVSFDDDTFYHIEVDIYFKYHLKAGLSMAYDTYKKMVDENHVLFYTRLGILRLKRMQTKKELNDYLIEKGCRKEVAYKLVKQFEEKRYLNDSEYARVFVEMKKNQQGPKLLQKNLLKKGVDQSIIDSAILKIDQHEILDHLIIKKYLSYKHKTKQQALVSTKNHFLLKGFDRELIDQVLIKVSLENQKDDSILLSKHFDKLYIKYKDQLEGYELKQMIKQKLYQKGFTLKDIETICIDKEVLS